MKRVTIALCSALLLAGTSAFAQSNQNSSTSGQKAGDPYSSQGGVQPGSAGESMNRAADAGSARSGGQGSLMQKRESGMSPEGASGGSATGKMKQ